MHLETVLVFLVVDVDHVEPLLFLELIDGYIVKKNVLSTSIGIGPIGVLYSSTYVRPQPGKYL